MDTPVNPQREHGHLDIANELVDQLAKLHLSGNEWQIVWAVLRKTWSWHKKEDAISLTQFQKLTGLSRPAVNKATKQLVAKRILVAKQLLYIHTYSFNKVYSQWTSSKIATSSILRTRVVAKQLPKLVAKQLPTKETKEIYTKETNNTVDSVRSSISWFLRIPDTVLGELQVKYKCSVGQILETARNLHATYGKNNRKVGDCRALLESVLKRNFGLRKTKQQVEDELESRLPPPEEQIGTDKIHELTRKAKELTQSHNVNEVLHPRHRSSLSN